MSIGQNIKQRRKQLDLTLEDLARLMGVSRQTLSRYETGVIANIPPERIEALAAALRTTPAALMGWQASLPEGVLAMPPMCRIPLVGSIACGTPVLADENIEMYVDIPQHIHADFALRCKGDSMINARIFDGDMVYIRQQDTADDGQIAAVLVEDEATLKRVRRLPDRLILQPENPTHQPMVFWGDQAEHVRILGIAVAFTSIVR